MSDISATKVKLLPKSNWTEGRKGHKVKYIVIHYNAGNLTLDGCYDVLKNRKVSAHYQVDASGRSCQYVYDSDTAWHAGSWTANLESIGIEHANRGLGSNSSFTDATINESARLIAGLCKKFKLGTPKFGKNIFPHHHFKATSCPGNLDKGENIEKLIKLAGDYYKNDK